MDLDDLLEFLEEAREQVDAKYPRGKVQTSMILKMDPNQFCKWIEAHSLLWQCREED